MDVFSTKKEYYGLVEVCMPFYNTSYNILITQTATKTSSTVRYGRITKVTLFFMKCGRQNFHMIIR